MIELICCAIRFKSLKTGGLYELYGKTHHDIIGEIYQKGLNTDYKRSHINGYIIKENGKKRFITEEEARKLNLKLTF